MSVKLETTSEPKMLQNFQALLQVNNYQDQRQPYFSKNPSFNYISSAPNSPLVPSPKQIDGNFRIIQLQKQKTTHPTSNYSPPQSISYEEKLKATKKYHEAYSNMIQMNQSQSLDCLFQDAINQLNREQIKKRSTLIKKDPAASFAMHNFFKNTSLKEKVNNPQLPNIAARLNMSQAFQSFIHSRKTNSTLYNPQQIVKSKLSLFDQDSVNMFKEQETTTLSSVRNIQHHLLIKKGLAPLQPQVKTENEANSSQSQNISFIYRSSLFKSKSKQSSLHSNFTQDTSFENQKNQKLPIDITNYIKSQGNEKIQSFSIAEFQKTQVTED